MSGAIPAGLSASIPSPSTGVWQLGPIPIRAYAFCIIAGVILAVWLGERRWQARGGDAGDVIDVAVIAVPIGIVGARLYHVVTDWQLYRDRPVEALKIWEGGLGIWGGIAVGGLAAWWACHRRGIRILPFGDAVAPGIALAQAVGRWGNWFNQELFGRPTDLPWGLEIDPEHRPAATPDQATYHPTFLYESLWCVGVAAVVIWADRRFRLGGGRAFFLYVSLYCLGRVWIEMLRVDPANQVGGLRLNVWTSLVVGLAAAVFVVARRGVRRENPEELRLTPTS